MALKMIGKVFSIGATQSIPSKNGNTFNKRELVLDATRFDPYTGERDKFENFPQFEFSGEKCSELDKCKVGDVVTISFTLQGSFYKGQDGIERNFTRIRCYEIEVKQTSSTKKEVESENQIHQKDDDVKQEEKEDLPF